MSSREKRGMAKRDFFAKPTKEKGTRYAGLARSSERTREKRHRAAPFEMAGKGQGRARRDSFAIAAHAERCRL